MFYGTDIFIIGLVAWFFLAKTKKTWFDSTLIVSLIILASWLILSAFHVKPHLLGLYEALKWIELLSIIYLSPSILQNKQDIDLVLVGVFISSIFQSVVGYIQFHVQHMIGLKLLGEYVAPVGTTGLSTIDYMGEKLVRAYGTFPHPNILAAYLIFGLFAGLYLVSRGTKVNKLLVSCGTLVVSLGIFFTFARLAWAVAALAMISYVLFYIIKKRYMLAILIVMVGIVSCGTVLLYYPHLLYARGAQLTSDSNSIVLRETFNRMGLEILKERPLTGIGVGNYIETMRNKFQLQDWQYQPAHNIFIFLAAESGIIGLALFLNLFYQILRSTWNKKKFDQLAFCLISIFVSYIIFSLFDHYFVTIQQGQLMLFTLLGLIVAYNNLPVNDVAQN